MDLFLYAVPRQYSITALLCVKVSSLRPVCPVDEIGVVVKKYMKRSWNDTEMGEIGVPGEKPVRLPLCPTKMSHV